MVQTLHPDKLVKEAKSAYKKGEFLSAAQAFAAASQAYLSAGEVVRAAEMANNQSVALLKAGDGQAALACVENTPAIFDQAGELRLHAMALANQAAALEAVGRRAEAGDIYQQAAEQLASCGEDEMRLQVMQALSALQLRSGRAFDALASMQDGLSGVEKPSPKQRLLKKLLNGGLVRSL